MAALSFGIPINYAKNAPEIKEGYKAHGSLWASVIITLSILPFFPVRESITLDIFTAAILLGVLCTGFSYLLNFRLIAELGASSALSVTFLVPVFGVLWGHIFLDKVVGINTLTVSILVISGTVFVTGIPPIHIFKRKSWRM